MEFKLQQVRNWRENNGHKSPQKKTSCNSLTFQINIVIDYFWLNSMTFVTIYFF